MSPAATRRMNIKCLCDHCPNSTCLLNDGGFCYSEAKLDDNGAIIKSYNCYTKKDPLFWNLICDKYPTQTAPAATTQQSYQNTTPSQIRICCDNKDYCNEDPRLLPPDIEISKILKTRPTFIDLKGLQIPFFVSLVLLIMVLFITIQKYVVKKRRLERSDSTGSGSGQPYLTQRSISHDIQLDEVVGRGCFGVVWRGKYRGEPVAVKIFSPIAEPSWIREAEIYQTMMLRHRNLLGFIATDVRYDNSMPGYWLVTDYYPMGSLYDFLRENSLTIQDTYRMSFSIANGLAHLHTEIPKTHISQGKPAIAHRDLKSKNILVKNDGTCCIGDLGMAVRYDSATGKVDAPTSIRVGTRRYLAPELLDGTLDLSEFEGVKACDNYALGLVLWEVLRRTCMTQPNVSPSSSMPSVSEPLLQTSTSSIQSHHHQQQQQKQQQQQQSITWAGTQQPPQNTPQQQQQQQQAPPPQVAIQNQEDITTYDLGMICDSYEVPYQAYAPFEPSTEEMREIVCVKKIRPPISLRWTRFPAMHDYVKVMSECWYEKPKARLSALRVRKTLSVLAKHHFDQNMEYD